MHTLLSFDQSSRCTGYSVFQDDKLIEYNKFNLIDDDIGTRLVQFRKTVLELIEHYHPDEIVFEDIQEQNNIQTFKVLACIYGIMLELVTSLNIPYSIMPSTTWKSTLGIKGKDRSTQKRNAQIYVADIYDIKPTQDEVDSICIGVALLNKRKGAW